MTSPQPASRDHQDQGSVPLPGDAAASGEPAADAPSQRVERWLGLTQALAPALEPHDVVGAAIRYAMDTLGAAAVSVTRVASDGARIEELGSAGFSGAVAAAFRGLTLDRRLPLTDALREGRARFFHDFEARTAAYPELALELRAIGHQALAILPFAASGSDGALTLHYAAPRVFDTEERAFLLATANQVGQALERARLYAVERAAREEARGLFELTGMLVRAEALTDVIEPALDSILRLLDVHRASILLFDRDGVMRFAGWRGLSATYRQAVEGHSPWQPDTRGPMPILVPDVLDDSSLSDYRPVFAAENIRSLGFFPLETPDGVLGKFMVYDERPRRLTASELRVAGILATQVSQGVLRIRLLAAEREARARSEFLSDATAVLAESLDVDVTLRRIAELAVPTMADWCAVDVFEDGRIERKAVVHADPAKVALAQELIRRWPPDPASDRGVGAVLRGGPGELIEVLTDATLAAAIADPELLRIVRDLGLHSVITVPIQARGVPLGAVTFAHAESRRRYGQADFEAARHIGRRAGLALDNARLYRAARDADRRKDEFLAVLGHELRNPLAPIATALHLIRLKTSTGIEREIALIDRQVGHLTRLVDDLLDLSRITRGKVRLNRETIDLESVVAKAIELAGPLIEQRGHRLTVRVAAGLAVEGDPVRLAQVFANLLTNAAKYTDDGGRIEIDARTLEEAGAVRVTVHDDGIGIAPDLLGRIFEQFVQDEQSKDRAQGGLGIGLALVRSLTELHGGSVAAASDGPGRGSTFTVTLPRAPTAANTTAARADGPPHGSSAPLRILVVDDIEDVRLPLAEVLRQHGHEVAMACDGPTALREVARFGPDVAIVDIGLPVMDGYELAVRLREAAPRVRLLAMTGYGLDSDRERAHRAGFDRHLVKPVAPTDLLRALEASRAVC